MRYPSLLLLLALLPACSMLQETAVDPKTLPPLSGQERALLISADASMQVGDFTAAEKNYLSAVARSKGHVIAHLSLADLYLRQKNTKAAEAILDKAAALHPNNPEVNWWLGKLALKENDAARALEYFQAGLKNDTADVNLLTGAGLAQDMLHAHEAAQVLYLRALSLNPTADLSVVRTNLAMSYLLSDEAQKAVKLLQPEVKKKGAPLAMKHNLALAYGVLGQDEKAKKLLGSALSESERKAGIARLKAHIAADKAGDMPHETKNETPTSSFFDGFKPASPTLGAWARPIGK